MMKNYLFLLLLVPLVILIILALPGKRSFRFSGEAILEQIGQNTHIISVHKFKEFKAGEPGIQLVDLRGVTEFANGHLPEAVTCRPKVWVQVKYTGFSKAWNPTACYIQVRPTRLRSTGSFLDRWE